MVLEYLLSYRGSFSLKALFWLHIGSLLSLSYRVVAITVTSEAQACQVLINGGLFNLSF